MLTARDAELLRTLLRLQVVPTTLLRDAFFPTARRAQQRLQQLRAAGLVTTHTKGLPPAYAATCAAYWRLTRRGVVATSERFPEERLPENAAERAAQTSLAFHQHRDAIAALYLEIVGDGADDVAALTARASSFGWRREHDVVLELRRVDGVRRVVPDATVEAAACGSRIFLELDRSTESTRRCRRTVERYAALVKTGQYRERFVDDALEPYVVYVVKTDARRASLHKAFASVALGDLRVAVLAQPDAVRWLRQALFGVEDVGAAPTRSGAARGDEAGAAARQEALRYLRKLYRAYREEIDRRVAAGDSADYPSWVNDVAGFLNAQRGDV